MMAGTRERDDKTTDSRVTLLSLISLLVCLVLLSVCWNAANAADREALIIANSAYSWEQPLKNPIADAEIIRTSLTQLGFAVEVITDADRREMHRAVRDFGTRLQSAKIGIFYYAGHGAQDQQQNNYLIPLATQMETDHDLAFEGYPATSIAEAMQNSNVEVSLIFLDACRNQPFPPSVISTNKGRSRGLSSMQVQVRNSMIIYSTAEGATADDGDGNNSPFALAVQHTLAQADTRLQDIPIRIRKHVIDLTNGRQIPFDSHSIYADDITLSQGKKADEGISWEETEDCHSIVCYQAYLAEYPNGQYYDTAKDRIATLQNQTDQTGDNKSIEQTTDLDYEQIADKAFIGRLLSNKQIQQLKMDAAKNNPKALAIMSILYDEGKGVKKDPDHAFSLATRSAEADEVLGMVRLSYMYRKGVGVDKNEQMAYYWIEQAVRHDNAHAYRNMGHYWRFKNKPDYERTIYWYAKAIDLDDVMTQSYVGDLYRIGNGVERDDEIAFDWYQTSALQGYTRAQNYLGWMYANGRGVEQDYASAAKWYRRAADQGFAKAQNNLGTLYANGFGVQKNLSMAVAWLSKAAEKDDPIAQANLAVIYIEGAGVEKDLTVAIKWLEASAQQDYILSQLKLGEILENQGLSEQSQSWYQRACNRGSKEACNKLPNQMKSRDNAPYRDQAKKVQRLMANLGCYDGQIDGLFGKGSVQSLNRLIDKQPSACQIEQRLDAVHSSQPVPKGWITVAEMTRKQLYHCQERVDQLICQ